MSADKIQNVSNYYDLDYFNWQKDMGVFGGWANAHIFENSISRTDTVIDFGCGGGFLLRNLSCMDRIGIEPNLAAQESAKHLGIKCFSSPRNALDNLGEAVADVIISTNALEHMRDPGFRLNCRQKECDFD
jgi:2-polyprenyl-3-methyl-5-hydroxy-6-metoxy-1,4-benzoquinol methylase